VLILDTDAVTVLFRREASLHQKLLHRLERDPDEFVATTIVTIHEQLQGWLAVLNRRRLTGDELIRTYRRLGIAI
jgi:hypothetical protein